MPYTPMYPQNYPQFPTYQPYQQPVIQQPVSGSFQTGNNQPMQQPTPQIQNGGFISVRSEQDARAWPVAPGNSITFKDENAPFVYIKTMGFNAFEAPQFVKYRLVREEAASEAPAAPVAPPDAPPMPAPPAYALQSDVDAIRGAVEAIKSEVEDFRARMDELTAKKPGTRKKEGDDNG